MRSTYYIAFWVASSDYCLLPTLPRSTYCSSSQSRISRPLVVLMAGLALLVLAPMTPTNDTRQNKRHVVGDAASIVFNQFYLFHSHVTYLLQKHTSVQVEGVVHLPTHAQNPGQDTIIGKLTLFNTLCVMVGKFPIPAIRKTSARSS